MRIGWSTVHGTQRMDLTGPIEWIAPAVFLDLSRVRTSETCVFAQFSLHFACFFRSPEAIGPMGGLWLMLNASSDEYSCSLAQSSGFLIAFHKPYELPMMEHAQLIAVAFETRFHITPLKISASPDIRSISMDYRECVFQNEQRLQFFKYVE